ncbi:MAG: 2-oxo acid dehydrogenase subunit E2 [Saprospirales bacterium]|nr:MAG: 2-oxo acid dehydrogenase subunit E2 [Saprospirales bacterium]
MIEFKMPNLGADMEDGTLVEWRMKPGDTVKRGDIIADVETQKGLIEIEVFDEGVIEKFMIKEGDKVPVGTVLALIQPIEDKRSELKKDPVSKPVDVKVHPIEEDLKGKPSDETTTPERVKISPLARKIAETNKIDLSRIKGTGQDGAITRQDVESAIERVKKTTDQPELPEEQRDKEKTPQGETIRSAIAAAMSKSNREIPHYYLSKKINMQHALDWMGAINKERPPQKRLLLAALLIKAIAHSLQKVPELNATWENGLRLKSYINIGFVIALRGGGILIPAIQRADEKSVDEIMEALNDIIPRAKAMKLRSSELSESTITVTSLGEGGADEVFGMIYPPQVAIIGFGSIVEQPFAENGMMGIRPVISATLAGDHRATDGLSGSLFLTALSKCLQKPEEL